MIERCGDRQRKFDGLKKWPLHFFIESLPVMLQAALLLLAYGLCRHMWSINSWVAYTLVGLTGLGATFFIGIVIAGTSSYACPFQTPASAALRGPWKRVRRGASFSGRYSIHILQRIISVLKQRVRSLLRHPLLPIAIPVRNAQVRESEPWLEPKDLAIIRRTNTDDVRCVSWILWNITDPEALDAAVRLAGTIRWFDDGNNVDPPYDVITSIFEACFDSTGKLYPGSRDRAYYSGRAMVWIRALALRKPLEFSHRFPLSRAKYEGPGLDPDLRDLLRLNQDSNFDFVTHMGPLTIDREHTPSHVQWFSDVVLHSSWGTRFASMHWRALKWFPDVHQTNITINVTLNCLLVWCIVLGSPPAEEALKVQNKSYDNSYYVLLITHNTLP